jgi:hypothetical protein
MIVVEDTRVVYGVDHRARPAAWFQGAMQALVSPVMGFFFLRAVWPDRVMASFVVLVIVLSWVSVYDVLWRHVYRLELVGDTLRWYGPLRKGQVPVHQLAGVQRGWLYPPRFVRAFRCRLRLRDGGALSVAIRDDLAPFIRALRASEPRIEVRPARWAAQIGV